MGHHKRYHARIHKVLSGVKLRQRFFPYLLIDRGREDPNSTISGSSSARHRNAIGPVLLRNPIFVSLQGVPDPCPPLDPRIDIVAYRICEKNNSFKRTIRRFQGEKYKKIDLRLIYKCIL